MDLSSPQGSSVNDGIDPDEFSMHYIKLDQIISMVLKHEPGALMARFDVKAAYRNIAVYPDDQYLLGMKWRGQFFVDLALPFGLCSAPYIFNSLAGMVEWIILNRYNVADLMHYLDNFLMACPAGSNQCAQNLQTSLAVCQSLGLLLHPGKCIGPVTRLVVLGIELDSIEQSTHLPAEKLANLQELIQSWRSRRWCTRRHLESLIGHLHHAAKVVWPGHTFLRHMIDLLCCFCSHDHPIHLNSEFLPGIVRASGCFQGCLPPPTWKSLWMLQAPWVLALILILNGSVALGSAHKLINPLPIKNFSLCW